MEFIEYVSSISFATASPELSPFVSPDPPIMLEIVAPKSCKRKSQYERSVDNCSYPQGKAGKRSVVARGSL